MAQTRTRGLRPDIRPLIEHMGWQEVLRQTGLQKLIAQLTPAQRQELIEQVGVKPIIEQVGLAPFLAALTPKQRQEALRLLEQTTPSKDPKG